MVPPHRPYASWRSVVGVTHSSASLQHLALNPQPTLENLLLELHRYIPRTIDGLLTDDEWEASLTRQRARLQLAYDRLPTCSSAPSRRVWREW